MAVVSFEMTYDFKTFFVFSNTYYETYTGMPCFHYQTVHAGHTIKIFYYALFKFKCRICNFMITTTLNKGRMAFALL